MDVSPQSHEIHGAGANSKWFSSSGLGSRGQAVELNFFADSQADADCLAQGLGIAHDVHAHKKAVYVAPKSEYDSHFGD